MSTETVRKQASALLAGRWQVPLALVAAVLASVTLYRLIPPAQPFDFDALAAQITTLEHREGSAAAAEALAALLRQETRLTDVQRAALHERLAELLFRIERGQPVHSLENARRLLEHSRLARDLGRSASPRTALREAHAARWLGEEEAALNGFRAALQADIAPEDRRVALRAIVELLEGRPEANEERRRAEEKLLGDESVSAAYVWWGLQRAVREALAEDDPVRARDLLTQYGDRLKTSDLKGYLDYLWACVMLHEGRPTEAAPLVRWTDEWLTARTSSASELDDFGHLGSLNRLLSGRLRLADEQLTEALSEFDVALEYRPEPELRVVVQLSRGEALTGLQRHADALAAFESVAMDAGAQPAGRRRATLAELSARLIEVAGRQEAAGDYENALKYLTLAADVTPAEDPGSELDVQEHLGRLYQVAAQAASESESCRQYHFQAGRALERAARLATLDEPRRAALLWSAADEYDQSGRVTDARRMFEQFVAGRASHPAMPRALLRLGQTYEAGGEPEAALRWYARVIDEYPRLEEAARAKELTAGVLIASGPERFAEAERVLTELLSDGSITPDAAVYRDALLVVCELTYHQGRYGQAIGRFREFLDLYPDDPEQIRAQYTLADAYRRSAYALRDTAPEPGAPAVAEARQRFAQAAGLYEKLLAGLAPTALAAADAEAQLYARLALFNRADCLFEINDPESLRAALAVYRAAAARYETQPAALSAQVQIANVHLRLGEVLEAARAIERARWLWRAIPPENFAAPLESDRAAWEQFLTLVAASDLFQVKLSSAAWPPRTSEKEQ